MKRCENSKCSERQKKKTLVSDVSSQHPREIDGALKSSSSVAWNVSGGRAEHSGKSLIVEKTRSVFSEKTMCIRAVADGVPRTEEQHNLHVYFPASGQAMGSQGAVSSPPRFFLSTFLLSRIGFSNPTARRVFIE